MRVSHNSLLSVALLVLVLIDSTLRTPLPSARKRVTKDDSDDEAYSFWALNTGQDKGEHVQPQRGGHSSNVEGGRDGDHYSVADVTDATGSDIDEKSHADTGSRSHGRRDGDRGVALASPSTKRKLPFATGRSGKSNSAPQHDRKRRRRYRFSAPMPSDELDTGDETSGSVYVPRESPRGRGLSQPSHSSQRVHRLKKPRRECARSESIGHQGSPLKSSPSSSHVAPPVVNTTVVFEQQQWKGKIIDERHVSRERGRPRKQYRIRWAPSWVDSARLAAPKLIEDWEGKGREDA